MKLIINSVSKISLTQEYFNPSETEIKVQYIFPAASQACLCKFTAEYGKTKIKGVVRER